MRGLPPDVRSTDFVFILPKGLIVSGVVSWVLQMHRRLPHVGRNSYIIQHAEGPGRVPFTSAPKDDPHWSHLSSIELGQVQAEHVAEYRRRMPAVVVPNWFDETYAAYAMLSATESNRFRVLGICHSDDSVYFRYLSYYEPLIHRFLAVSEECADKLGQLIPGRSSDILVRPYPVEVPEKLSRSYAADSEPLRLLYAGRLVQAQKRVLDLLQLARLLRERGVNYRMRIVGEGLDRGHLEAAHAQLEPEIRHRILIEQQVPPEQMPDLLQQNDLALLVSAWEGTSVFMLEAMANGCIPVVTQVSGTRGVISPGINGYVAPPGDLSTMADAIAALHTDRHRLPRLGGTAYESAARFAYGPYLRWFSQLSEELWSEPPRVWPQEKPALPVPQNTPPPERRRLYLPGVPTAKRILKRLWTH